MNQLKLAIHDEKNNLDDVLAGDSYIPVIKLTEAENRPVGKWGRRPRTYLENTSPLLLNHLSNHKKHCEKLRNYPVLLAVIDRTGYTSHKFEFRFSDF